MLPPFDWIRRSETGAELIATMEFIRLNPDRFKTIGIDAKEIGPPVTFSERPCGRCWSKSVRNDSKVSLCDVCEKILDGAKKIGRISSNSAVLWGYVQQPAGKIIEKLQSSGIGILAVYIHDETRFLTVIHRLALKPFFQELMIHHGSDLKGSIQIMPTSGRTKRGNMGDFLCRMIHRETFFPFDTLRVCFYPKPYQIFNFRELEEKGRLYFDVREFFNILKSASVFRSLIRKDEQAILYKLIQNTNPSEKMFYWGRLSGHLNPEARDMIMAWNFLNWPPSRVDVLYDLFDYVVYQN